MDHVRHRVGFENCFVVNTFGKKGGLALLWRSDLNLEIFTYSSSHITYIIRDINSRAVWFLTNFYGHLETSKRVESWDLLDRIGIGSKMAWCILGDFNKITTQDEKIGG